MGAEQAPKRGRPTDFATDLVDEFCRRVSEGRSVIDVCQDDDMPSHQTIYKWQRERREFADSLAHARAERSEAFSSQIVALGKRAISEDIDPARVRVAIDAIDKAARIMQPRKVELTGANGGPIKTQDLSRLTDEQLAALNAILGEVADVGGGEGGDTPAGDREGA
ncbi:hypothetical protein AB4Z40_08735 [Bosea sp. 2YAB26]|uniref:terminase small subunit-like protein n=1 Tax=Bosea sp. 2YAB26 TaxID=3237478 RepID=UPI003F8E958D